MAEPKKPFDRDKKWKLGRSFGWWHIPYCPHCKHSCEDLGSLYCCSFGPCVYSSVSPDFWCANGKRREDAHAQD